MVVSAKEERSSCVKEVESAERKKSAIYYQVIREGRHHQLGSILSASNALSSKELMMWGDRSELEVIP